MLLDEAQTAVSDLLEALHESLDDYQDNLQRLHNAEIAQDFNDAMNRRTELLDALEDKVRSELAIRPRAADIEREDFHHLWSKLKSLVFDEQILMLQERAEQERHLIALVTRCQSYDYPETITEQLQQLQQHLTDQLNQIKRFQSAAGH